MFKNKVLSCMLALGLTMSAAPAVLAGPNDTAGNSQLVDKTENPDDAPTTPPGEESSGTTPEGDSQAKPEGEGALTTPGEESSGTTTPEGEGTTTPEGESSGTTEGSGTAGEGTTTTPEGEGTTTTPDGSGTTGEETTTPNDSSSGSTSLPQTGAPIALLAPVLLVGGAAGFSIYKRSH